MADTDLKISEFLNAEGAQDWRVLSDGAMAFFRTNSLEDAASFVSAMSAIPGLAEHRYGIDIRPAGVTVRLVSLREDMLGLTTRDLDLARAISALAREQGLASDPASLKSFLIVPGAPTREIMPFWQAALGYVPRPDSPDQDLVDPLDRNIAFWFEEMEETRPGNLGAIHVAVWVPIEEAQARVDAALAAGGHVVRDDFAPAWWTLADAYGNEIDISTAAYRDEEPPAQ